MLPLKLPAGTRRVAGPVAHPAAARGGESPTGKEGFEAAMNRALANTPSVKAPAAKSPPPTAVLAPKAGAKRPLTPVGPGPGAEDLAAAAVTPASVAGAISGPAHEQSAAGVECHEAAVGASPAPAAAALPGLTAAAACAAMTGTSPTTPGNSPGEQTSPTAGAPGFPAATTAPAPEPPQSVPENTTKPPPNAPAANSPTDSAATPLEMVTAPATFAAAPEINGAPTTPESGTEIQVELLENAPQNPTKPPTTTQPKPAGISAAQQPALMKKDAQATHISGATEQMLPPGAMTAMESVSPAGPARSLLPPEPREENELMPPVEMASISRPETSTTSTILPTLPLTSLARAVDRVEDLVTTHAMRLRSSGEETLSVVIKPGAGVQIALEVRQQPDGIEVQASLQHGDFGFLNRHWSDLQQQLETRGIRLQPLSSEQPSLAGNSSDSESRSSRYSEDQLAPVTKARGLTIEGVVAVASTPRPARRSDHWESWA